MNRKPEVIALRTAIRANPRLELEFKGRLSQLLRAYRVDVSNDLLSEIVLALQDEIDGTILVDTLPRPSLPPLAEHEPRPMVDSLPQPSLPPL